MLRQLQENIKEAFDGEDQLLIKFYNETNNGKILGIK